jgi:uncharacterized secreted repeat protein (TIGR03808 family)
VRGASKLTFGDGLSLIAGEHIASVTLSGLTLDGGERTLGDNRGLVHLNDIRALRLIDCDIASAGGNAVALASCDGAISGNAISGAADNGIFASDSRGLTISGNTIRGCGNGGIRVWQSEKRRDGSIVADNRIEDTQARGGGDGQNGNAINIFRAANVIVRGNIIRKAAFSAIRGNAASHIQMTGNNCFDLGEVAIYSEFDFEDAVIADNVIDRAAFGISVTNSQQGGRLASVRGNIIRNVRTSPGRPPAEQGSAIGVEADTAVTGNVIENAQNAGITAGWGEFLRNVTIQGNLVRKANIGVAVSVVKGAGPAVIAGNMFAGTLGGAVVGMEWQKKVTGDLALAGAENYPQLRISGNQIG